MTLALERRYDPADFVAENRNHYRKLWALFGYEWPDIPTAAESGNEAFMGQHGTINVGMSPEQRETAVAILREMGFFNASTATEDLDYILVTGKKFASMVEMLRHGNVVGRDAYGLFGQRPRTDKEDGTLESIQALTAELAPEVLEHKWYIDQMKIPHVDDWNRPVATEHELGILAMLIASRGAYAVHMQLGVTDGIEPMDDVPDRTVGSTLLRHTSTGALFNVYNAAAVRRTNYTTGEQLPSRPTAKSSAEHWLKAHKVAPDSKIGVLSGLTHWFRVVGDTERVFLSIDPTLKIFALARGTTGPEQDLELVLNALGEAARLLSNFNDEMLERFQLLDEQYASARS